MPKIISNETESDIKRLSKENYSKVSIKNKLKEEVVDLSIKTIIRIIKNIGIKRQATSQGRPVQKIQRPDFNGRRIWSRKLKGLPLLRIRRHTGISKNKLDSVYQPFIILSIRTWV